VTHDLAVLRDFPRFCDRVLGLDLATRFEHMAIARAFDGQPLTDAELEWFQRYTGRSAPRAGGYPYLVELFGRQCGKSEMAAAHGAQAGAVAAVSGQRDVAVVLMAQDTRASIRVAFTYIRRFFERPLLRDLVVAVRQESIELAGNVSVVVMPCRPAAPRGLRVVRFVLDEFAHFLSTDNRPLDKQAWAAALPTLLTTAGKLIALTSPRLLSGLAGALYQRHYGQDDSDVLIVRAPSIAMNPTLSDEALRQIRDSAPDDAPAELDGEFLMDACALIDEELIDAAVDRGVTVRRPVAERHVAHVDVSTGASRTSDRWAVAVAHRAHGCGVVDALLVIQPPFSVATACAQTAALCRSFGIREIYGDAFARGFSEAAFAAVGLRWRPAGRTTSDSYIEFAAHLSSGRVRLLDREELLRELRTLERRRGAARDRIDHRRGTHDDAAAAVAGAVVGALAQGPGASVAVVMPRGSPSDPSWRQRYF
jgi:hypothetical protein